MALVSNLGTASLRPPTPEGPQSAYSLSYFEAFPPGYRFKPSDQELIQYYLQNKVDGRPLPPNKIIEEDIYLASPEYLSEKYKNVWPERDCYFFTPRNRKYKNGHRPNRRTLDGHWKATGSGKPIGRRNTVGYKRTLVYYKGNFPRGNKTDWIMHEYTIDSKTTRTGTSDMRLDDVVLCKIFKRETKARKGKKAEGGADQVGASSTWDTFGNGRNEEMYNPINYNNAVTNFPRPMVEHHNNCQHFQNYYSQQPEPNIVPQMNCYPPQPELSIVPQMNYYPSPLEPNMASQLNYCPPQPEPNIVPQMKYYPSQPEPNMASQMNYSPPQPKPNIVRQMNYYPLQLELNIVPQMNHYPSQPEPNMASQLNYCPPQPEPNIVPQMKYYPSQPEPNMASQMNYYPPQPEPNMASQLNYCPPQPEPNIGSQLNYYPPQLEPNMASQLNCYPPQPESNITSQLGNSLSGLLPPLQVQAPQEFNDELMIDEVWNGFLLDGRPTSEFEVPSENDFNYLSEFLDPSLGFGSNGFSEDQFPHSEHQFSGDQFPHYEDNGRKSESRELTTLRNPPLAERHLVQWTSTMSNLTKENCPELHSFQLHADFDMFSSFYAFT
ncbi:NAC domain [Dillenia turbinata]|uniref:NAC domain n=1 Tax=Dillenia turbinata TaxID=194707 RepID=A0AAN8ZC11_9MAGN